MVFVVPEFTEGWSRRKSGLFFGESGEFERASRYNSPFGRITRGPGEVPEFTEGLEDRMAVGRNNAVVEGREQLIFEAADGVAIKSRTIISIKVG